MRRIWVKSCYAERDLPDGVHCRYDVFDATGCLETEVRIVWQVNSDRDYFSMLDDGRFLWILNGRSAVNARFADIENRESEEEDLDEDLDEDELRLQVILLERDQ